MVQLPGRRPLGPIGACQLRYILGGACGLTMLELAHNHLGSEGATALGQSLSGCLYLTRLGLLGNDIGPIGAGQLKTALTGLTCLRSLSLEGNGIGAAGWVEVAGVLTCLSALTSLNGFDSYADLLSGGAKELLLHGRELAAVVKDLLPCSAEQLATLDISDNFLDADGGKFQQRNECAIAASLLVLESLGTLSALTWLRVDGNMLGVAGGRALGSALRRLGRLTHLDASRACLGPMGAAEIARAFRFLTELQTLTLIGNGIGAGEAVFSTLSSLIGLVSLDLSENGLGAAGIEGLVASLSALSGLEWLAVSDNVLGPKGGTSLAMILGNLTRLCRLDVRQNDLGPDGGLAVLQGLAEAVTAKSMAGCKPIRRLDLRDNGLGEGVTVSGVASAMVAGLTALVGLEELLLAGNGLDRLGMEALASGLISHTALRVLDLGGNNLGADGGRALGVILAATSGLHTLYLDGNSLRAEGFRGLMSGLSNLVELHTLDLRDNRLGKDGGKAVGEGVKTLLALETLDLDGNELGSEGGVAVAAGAAELSALRALDLRDNELGVDGIRSVSELLSRCDLLHLDLRWNELERRRSVASWAPVKALSRLLPSPAAGRLRKTSSVRVQQMAIRGWLRKLNTNREGEMELEANWRDRLCFVQGEKLWYTSAKKKGEPELVANLTDIVEV
jgi:Ran GTPase-activating protein (RanGAP) involved in mRNA processing and transport